MSDTSIEWATKVWNPTTGCDRVSPGCDNCYALTMAKRLKGMGSAKYQNDGDPKTSGPGFAATMHSHTLDEVYKWRKPQRVFVNSMSDLFHDAIDDYFIWEVFARIAASPQHTFMVLTKRHGRMRSLMNAPVGHPYISRSRWPLKNLWLGVSAENQQWATIRGNALRETPAAVRFLSCEPLLGRINDLDLDGIHWLIAGGESGPGARPMHPDWARGLRDQCQAAGVPFFFKQRGEWTWNEGPNDFSLPTSPYSNRVAVMHGAGMTAMTKNNPFNPFERGHPYWDTRIERVGKHRAGRLLDGREWNEYPA